MKIAILADLHIGSDARGKDLNCEPSDKAIDENYKKKFIDFLKANDINADYLLIAGDISNSSQFQEIEIASSLVNDISKALGVHKKKIYFVTGNHDVDWSILKNKTEKEFNLRWKKRYDAIKQNEYIFSSLLKSAKGKFDETPYYNIWEDENIVVVGINSSWHDNPTIAMHHGMVDQGSINQLGDELKVFRDKPKIKICLVHHHPFNYSDPFPEPDFSAMTNSENLLRILNNNNFDFLIHGHKHIPQFRTDIINSNFPLVSLGAGSFSVALSTKYSGVANNQFHLIDIEKRDSVTNCVQGKVYSWAFVHAKGWIESKNEHGINHLIPFGSYVQKSQIISVIEPFIHSHLKNNSFLKWSKIIEHYKYLDKVPFETIKDVLDSISEKSSHIEIHYADTIIILKNEE